MKKVLKVKEWLKDRNEDVPRQILELINGMPKVNPYDSIANKIGLKELLNRPGNFTQGILIPYNKWKF